MGEKAAGIAFFGRRQVGKDTAAKYVTEFVSSAHVFHFADPLKRVACDFLGIEGKLLWGSDADKAQPTEYEWRDPTMRDRDGIAPTTGHGRMTVREVLQVLGTDIFRKHFGINVHVRALWREIGAYETALKATGDRSYDVFPVIADGRFPNEVEACKAHGFVTARLRKTRDAEGRTIPLERGHASETALDDLGEDAFDYDIALPHGALRDLRRQVAVILVDAGVM